MRRQEIFVSYCTQKGDGIMDNRYAIRKMFKVRRHNEKVSESFSHFTAKNTVFPSFLVFSALVDKNLCILGQSSFRIMLGHTLAIFWASFSHDHILSLG